jgi:predicted permease
MRPRVDRWTHDIRFAARSLTRRPFYSLTVIAIVALGIGAVTTIFSVVDGILLRPLPYPGADRLVRVWKGNSSVPVPDYLDFERRTESFEAWGAAWDRHMDLSGAGTPVRVKTGLLTPRVFEILGAHPVAGRLFILDDFAGGMSSVAVLSNDLWSRRWGQDPAVIGRTVRLDGKMFTIVGVLESDFVAPEGLDLDGTDVYVPLDAVDPDVQNRNMFVLSVVARLRPGLSYERARAELDVLQATLQSEFPGSWSRDGEPLPIRTETLSEATLGNVGATLGAFFGAVGLLLLIACANVANLSLVRALDRSREIAIRGALGAGRARLMRQLVTESVLLSVAGGVAGLVLAVLGVSAFRHFDPGGIPRLAEVTIDVRVLVFAIGLAVATGVAFGLAPAWLPALRRPQLALRSGGYSGTAGPEGRRLRGALVALETALAVVLLVGAGLLFHSFLTLRSMDIGFAPEQLTTLQIDIRSVRESSEYAPFLHELIGRLEGIPGVTSVGASWQLPFDRGRCCVSGGLIPAGMDTTMSAYFHPATPGYFDALGVPLLAGRVLTEADETAERERNARVGAAMGDSTGEAIARLPRFEVPIVVGRTLAELAWPEARDGRYSEVLGRTLRSPGSDSQEARVHTDYRVVGVIEDIRHWSLDREYGRNLYLPFETYATWISQLDVAIRHTTPESALAPAVRAVLLEIEPDLPVGRIASMDSRISASAANERFNFVLLSTFASVAFLLAAAGIYGSLLYDVRSRRREIGIRIALGAHVRPIVSTVLRRGLALTGIGLGLGLIAALALSRLLEGLVFGISTSDPITYGASILVLVSGAVAACWIPAARAARTDPVRVLRLE